MKKILTLALLATMLTGAASQAQQGTAGGSASGGTPGVPPGTTGTTYATPGGMPMPGTPGGTVPMAAGTQDVSKAPSALPTFNNSASDGRITAGGH